MFWLWALLIYWLLLFVVFYIVVEVGQNYFYDEITPMAGLKVGGSSLAVAAALTWWSPSSVDLFTEEIWLTAMLGIAGFVLFTLVMRFHAPHALLVGPPTVILVAFTAAMAIDSLADSGRSIERDRPIPPSQRTIRKSASTSLIPPAEEPAPEPGTDDGPAPGATTPPTGP